MKIGPQKSFYMNIRKHFPCEITKCILQTNLYTCATVNILLVELLSVKKKLSGNSVFMQPVKIIVPSNVQGVCVRMCVCVCVCVCVWS